MSIQCPIATAPPSTTRSRPDRDARDGAGLAGTGRPVVLPPAESVGTDVTWHHATVLAHDRVGDRYRYLRLAAPSIAARTRPGQFVMLTVAHGRHAAPVLPRPMAVYETGSDGSIGVVYGVVGDGTEAMAGFVVGEPMLTIGPLGRGYQLYPQTRRLLVVGRGIGTCSLTLAATRAVGDGVHVDAVASGRNSAALIGVDSYRTAGIADPLVVQDSDGSSDPDTLESALRGRLDDDPPQQIFTCGSDRLTRLCARLAARWHADVQVSLEAHMACGLGYCHGCSSGQQSSEAEEPLICRDGPVFGWRTAAERTTG